MTTETNRCLREGALNFATIMWLLIDKGIITQEEFDQAKIMMGAELDQAEADRRDS